MSLMKKITQRIKEIIFWRRYWKEEEIVATTKRKAKKTIKRMSEEDKEYVEDISNLMSDMLWADQGLRYRSGGRSFLTQKTIKRTDDE
jgi:hypothetical protein